MANYPTPTPDPFNFSGNSTGLLLIHGFTGSPSEMRPMGEYLASQGYTVPFFAVAGLTLVGLAVLGLFGATRR